ncbi:RNA pseudouridine synthase [Hydrogenophaga laconesensis]|uniref:Dual-specificity RNA pseudouridine synthase RluF n=1 Tax=Hydrogenophaga laconesensis TaxID=1805971 RepID=A0ABU1VBS9_9BURK|nr:RNA pseudouridine synthase [Hydrogenophaga laconesensis]MDR7094936.1 23S rRNA pseudouridine2604 synthase [Hydrogenophaga laconesensis]
MNETIRPAEPQRLAKRLAAQLPCSRRDAELYIAGGWVRVDGTVVEEPMARVRDAQTVELDPRARLDPLVPVTLVWHKPAGAALPEAQHLPDEEAARWFAAGARFAGDRSGIRPLKVHLHRLLPVAPLEVMSSGLMVFTQNPGVARRINDTSSPLEHEWLVDVQDDPALDDDARREAVLQSFGKALFFDGWAVPAARASWQSERRLRLAIKGTLPGQVAHLAERAGLRLVAVRRQRLGRIGLDGLPSGQWRYAAAHERF